MGYDPDDSSIQLDLAWIRYLLWREITYRGGDPRMLGLRRSARTVRTHEGLTDGLAGDTP